MSKTSVEKIPMRLNVCRISFLLTSVVLTAAMIFLTTSRPEYCGQPTSLMPQPQAAVAAPSPTLAPPQKVVVVCVEADKPDIEIGWAKN
jgi:hypothetical protein